MGKGVEKGQGRTELSLTSDASAEAWTRAPQLSQGHRLPGGAFTQPHQFLHPFCANRWTAAW